MEYTNPPPTYLLLLLLLFPTLLCQPPNKCISSLLNNPSVLPTVVLSSGKAINDFGDPDACRMNSLTDYAYVTIKGRPVYVGLCLPSICESSDLQMVADAVTTLATQMGMKGEGQVYFPSRDPVRVSAWNVVGFLFFGIIGICFVLGMMVEYTNFMGDVPKIDESESDSKKDKALVGSKSLLGKIFLAFSPSRNLKKMFYTPQRDGDYLSAFNGIRVISMYLVIQGHTNAIMAEAGATNILSAFGFVSSWWAIVIGTGFYSVDVFFFISAFLATYLMISKFHGKRMFNIPMVYLHRIIRIVPTLLLLLALFFTFYKFLGSGPLWKPYVDQGIQYCKEEWWSAILFITAWNTKLECYGQLWYMSNDMTYFIFVPLFVLAYINSRRIGWILITAANLISIILPFIFSNIRGHSITILKDPAIMHIYEKEYYPYMRTASYAVGMLFGVLYFEWNKAKSDPVFEITIGARFYNIFKKSTILCYLSFILSSLVMLFFILIPAVELLQPKGRVISQFPSDLFNAFHRSLFTCAFGTFLAPVFVGRLPYLKSIFGGRFWAPWAKVTFISYLIHMNVLGWLFMQGKAALHFDGPSQIFYSLAALPLCLGLSVPIALVIESPVLQLERLVLFPEKKKEVKIEAEEEILIGKNTING